MAKKLLKFNPVNAGDEIVIDNIANLNMDLIWTNSSPTSQMGQTTLTTSPVDWDKVKYFIMKLKLHAQSTSNYYTSVILPVIEKATNIQVFQSARWDGSNNLLMGRQFGFSEILGFTVGSGYAMSPYGTWTGTNNNVMIPINIFAVY